VFYFAIFIDESRDISVKELDKYFKVSSKFIMSFRIIITLLQTSSLLIYLFMF
jgi:hypothetical protein